MTVLIHLATSSIKIYVDGKCYEVTNLDGFYCGIDIKKKLYKIIEQSISSWRLGLNCKSPLATQDRSHDYGTRSF